MLDANIELFEEMLDLDKNLQFEIMNDITLHYFLFLDKDSFQKSFSAIVLQSRSGTDNLKYHKCLVLFAIIQFLKIFSEKSN